MKKLVLASAVALSLATAGCATVLTGTTQDVNVQAINSKTHQVIPGARCTVTDGAGQAFPVGGNPGRVILTKGKGALNVKCAKSGYKQGRIGVGQSFNAFSVVNVLFWPGLLVDAATGAIQKYPSHITVLMDPSHRA